MAWLAVGLVALALALALGGCVPDPQRLQSAQLLERLVVARSALAQQPPDVAAACDTVGEVESRLQGEPGLVDVRPAWPALRASADALLAVCGQARLVAQATRDSPAVASARLGWQQAVVRELDVACRELQHAAAALGRPQVAC